MRFLGRKDVGVAFSGGSLLTERYDGFHSGELGANVDRQMD